MGFNIKSAVDKKHWHSGTSWFCCLKNFQKITWKMGQNGNKGYSWEKMSRNVGLRFGQEAERQEWYQGVTWGAPLFWPSAQSVISGFGFHWKHWDLNYFKGGDFPFNIQLIPSYICHKIIGWCHVSHIIRCEPFSQGRC